MMVISSKPEADDRIAAGIVRCDGDALPRLATDRVVAVGDCAGGRRGSACDRKRFL